MDVLYVCNEEMLRIHRLEATLNKTCSTNIIDPFIKRISTYSKIFHELVNNIFWLLDNIEKIMVFE
jgi:hypothetical protein